MGQIASPVYKHGGGSGSGSSSVKGDRANESFDTDDQVKAKRKADAYRTKKKKNFAWKPPAKAGLDPEWDSFDPDAATPPPAPKVKDPKLSDIPAK